MRFLFIFLFLTFFSFSIISQVPKGKLFILNEGAFGGQGSVGVADFDAGNYSVIDNQIATFGNQISWIQGKIYAVDGNGNIMIYDAISYVKVDSILGENARGVYEYNGQLLLTKLTAPYFRSLTLSAPHTLVYEIDTTQIPTAREGIVKVGDKAFISGFNNDNYVSVIDLTTQTWIKNITTPQNPFEIEQYKGKVYVACYTYTPNFTTDTDLQEIDPNSMSISNSWKFLNTSGLTAGDTALYLSMGNGKLAAFNPSTAVLDSNLMNLFAYGLQYETVPKCIFYSNTDYVSTGSVGYTFNNQTFNMIATDISPRSMFFVSSDSLALVHINELADFSYKIYPNPAQNELFIQLKRGNNFPFFYRIFDITGKELLQGEILTNDAKLATSMLSEGVYFLEIENEKGRSVTKFWKK